MPKKIDPLRLQQLELLLRWEGRLGNARLREIFGFTSVRASQCIREFRDIKSDWTRLNSVSKTYVATFQFYKESPKDHQTSLSQYLALVGLPSTVKNETNNSIVSAFTEITTPNPKFFSMLSMAVKSGVDVEITYSSMAEPKPHTRIISPHSIVKAGPRWHVRAYSEINQQFRDYTLGRISDVKLLERSSKFSIKDDKDWLTEVKVRLIAHPELSLEQESVIRFEYFANTSARITTCRGPIVNYFIKEVGAAIDIQKQRPPEYLLAVGNVEEISKWLFSK